jgi:hypothetical protein
LLREVDIAVINEKGREVYLIGVRLESNTCGKRVDRNVIAKMVVELYRLWSELASLKVGTCTEERTSEVRSDTKWRGV